MTTTITISEFVNMFNNVLNDIVNTLTDANVPGYEHVSIDDLIFHAHEYMPAISHMNQCMPIYDKNSLDTLINELAAGNQLEVCGYENGRLVTHDIYICYDNIHKQIDWSYGWYNINNGAK